ncbi:hypothetical protein T4B_3749 [Trichinella pseudospiralis]|uniref:Uncharacterized protein n=1 Tax=Trichinella pseudospiralis TaxID=6337 RepID=A0A0V1JFF8_TRIPS|nr:hypothetical protein T4B_3749 [Trichinella pseudospiralis]
MPACYKLFSHDIIEHDHELVALTIGHKVVNKARIVVVAVTKLNLTTGGRSTAVMRCQCCQ